MPQSYLACTKQKEGDSAGANQDPLVVCYPKTGEVYRGVYILHEDTKNSVGDKYEILPFEGELVLFESHGSVYENVVIQSQLKESGCSPEEIENVWAARKRLEQQKLQPNKRSDKKPDPKYVLACIDLI